MDNGMKIDPVSGNEIPPGAMAEEVRDDIPAQLSEGEYVIPADVVRYIGVDKLEGLVNQVKVKLHELEQGGRIQNAPPAEAPIENIPMQEAPAQAPAFAYGGMIRAEELNATIDALSQAAKNDPSIAEVFRKRGITMAEGGLVGEAVDKAQGDYMKGSVPLQGIPVGGSLWGWTGTGTEYRTFYGPNGEQITIMFVNGQPVQPIPEGYSATPPESGRGMRGGYSAGGGDAGGTNYGRPGGSGKSGMLFGPSTLDQEGLDSWINRSAEGALAQIGGLVGKEDGLINSFVALETLQRTRTAAIVAARTGNQELANMYAQRAAELEGQLSPIARTFDGLGLATGINDANRIFEQSGMEFVPHEGTGVGIRDGNPYVEIGGREGWPILSDQVIDTTGLPAGGYQFGRSTGEPSPTPGKFDAEMGSWGTPVTSGKAKNLSGAQKSFGDSDNDSSSPFLDRKAKVLPTGNMPGAKNVSDGPFPAESAPKDYGASPTTQTKTKIQTGTKTPVAAKAAKTAPTKPMVDFGLRKGGLVTRRKK